MPDAPAILDANLPTDVALLHGMIRELLSSHATDQRRIAQLEHRLDQLLKRMYGPRADRVHPDQGTLFDEFPAPTPDEPTPLDEASDAAPSASTAKSKGHGRRELPKNLQRVRETIDIPEADKLAVGGTWVLIGETVSEKLDYTPASLFVRQIVRPKYVVRFDDKPDELKVAELPPEALPKCKAAPGLVADVIVSKLVDHLPLYRQEQRFARQGVELARSTLCNWMAEAADVLTPLYAILKARVLSAGVVHTDDTPMPVQDDSREHCRTGRLWTYVSATGIVYDATETRARDGPLEFLRDFQGYLQCDAYAGYDEIVRLAQGSIVAVGCWAHARRKFVEAEKASPRAAHEAVARIRALYAIEDRARHLDAITRAALRAQEAQPLLDAFADWLERERVQAIPRTPLAEAITYATNQWPSLTQYVRDGRLAIDNNLAERAIKPFAIGRKNWLFFGSDRGGRTLATLASFTATCQQCEVNPWTWLRDTLTALPLTPPEQLGTLLPTPRP